MYRFYKVYLYRLVVILPSHDTIYKQKWIDLVCEIIGSAIILLLWLREDLFLGPRDGIGKGFFNIGTVCRVISLEIALFCICTTIVNKFGNIYGSNGSVIRVSNLFDLDIIWRPELWYFIYIWLHFSLLFQFSMVLRNQLILYVCMYVDFFNTYLISFALIMTIEISCSYAYADV